MTTPSSPSDNWAELPLSEAVQINPSIGLKRGEVYPFVDMASVDGIQRTANAMEEREFKGSGSKFQHGDTLMARITPCLENGKIAQYKALQDQQQAYGSTEFIVLRGRLDTTTDDFVYYLTRWEEVRRYAIGQMTGTSGRQRVPVDSLDHLTVPVPPIPVQRRVAHILGTLDDKIELNRQINETLEQMAHAMFKSWFVDFDPVRAKMDGRWQRGQSLPGLPAELYNVFTDRLVPSEIGEIPEGWDVQALGSFGQIITGKTPSTNRSEYFGGDVPFLRIPDMHGNMYALQTQMTLSTAGADSQPQKTLPPGSISVSCIATPGLVVLNHRTTQTNQQINSIIPLNQFLSRYLYWSCRDLSHDIEAGGLGGSVLGNMNKSSFSALTVLDAKSDVIQAFDQLVSSIHAEILANEQQNQTLAVQRDTLLPRLLSGKLLVAETNIMESV